MSIDQVTIFVLKSFSNLHVLKLFSNLFHKLPAWYASDLKPKFMVWHFGRRILLSERRLWLFYLVWTYIACIWVIDHSRPCKYIWHQIWRYIFHPHRSAAISFTPPPPPIRHVHPQYCDLHMSLIYWSLDWWTTCTIDIFITYM